MFVKLQNAFIDSMNICLRAKKTISNRENCLILRSPASGSKYNVPGVFSFLATNHFEYTRHIHTKTAYQYIQQLLYCISVYPNFHTRLQSVFLFSTWWLAAAMLNGFIKDILAVSHVFPQKLGSSRVICFNLEAQRGPGEAPQDPQDPEHGDRVPPPFHTI